MVDSGTVIVIVLMVMSEKLIEIWYKGLKDKKSIFQSDDMNVYRGLIVVINIFSTCCFFLYLMFEHLWIWFIWIYLILVSNGLFVMYLYSTSTLLKVDQYYRPYYSYVLGLIFIPLITSAILTVISSILGFEQFYSIYIVGNFIIVITICAFIFLFYILWILEDEWVENPNAEISKMTKATYYYGLIGGFYNALVWLLYFEYYDNKFFQSLLASTATVNCCLVIIESIGRLFYDKEFRMALIKQMIESNKNR